MAQIPNSVPLTGVIAPTDSADRFPVTDPIYGIDGLRCVPSSLERDAIPNERRRHGMLVFTQADGRYWTLQANGTWLEFTVNAASLNTLITNIVNSLLPAPVTTPATVSTVVTSLNWNKLTEGNPADALVSRPEITLQFGTEQDEQPDKQKPRAEARHTTHSGK